MPRLLFFPSLHETAFDEQQYQTVTAYDDDGVEFNLIRYEHSLIVLPEVTPFFGRFNLLTPSLQTISMRLTSTSLMSLFWERANANVSFIHD